MEPRTLKILFFLLDVGVCLTVMVTISLSLAYKYMIDQYPFIYAYIYVQFILLYLTFRVKFCPSFSISALYRFHLANFLFSLFNAVIGYIEIVKSINGDGILQSELSYFILECASLICAHAIIGIYVCCPSVTFSRAFDQRGMNQEEVMSMLNSLERQPLISFDSLELITEAYNESKGLRESTCSICLEDFLEGELLKMVPRCEHIFHEKCLRQWYNAKQVDTCPICRRRFNSIHSSVEKLQEDSYEQLEQDEEELKEDDYNGFLTHTLISELNTGSREEQQQSTAAGMNDFESPYAIND